MPRILQCPQTTIYNLAAIDTLTGKNVWENYQRHKPSHVSAGKTAYSLIKNAGRISITPHENQIGLQ